jgi:hypothetical protein
MNTTTATSTPTTARQCAARPALYIQSRDRQRREAARELGLDPDTGQQLPRPSSSEAATRLAELVAADAELLGHRDRIAALTALAAMTQAESARRSAVALESIAASLASAAAALHAPVLESSV